MSGAIRPGQSVAVVGGGLLGLTAALRLAQGGARVTVFEAAPQSGGLASAWTIETPTGPLTWDRFYHVTLASDLAQRGFSEQRTAIVGFCMGGTVTLFAATRWRQSAARPFPSKPKQTALFRMKIWKCRSIQPCQNRGFCAVWKFKMASKISKPN